MTKQEYQAAYRATRKTAPRLTRSTMIEVRQAYKTATIQVAEQVRKAQLSGVSSITIDSLKNINIQMAEGSRLITEALESSVPIGVKNISSRITSIDEEYLVSSLNKAKSVLDKVVIKDMFLQLNEDLLWNTTHRIFSDGYTFSERVWKVGQSYDTDMRRVLSSGLAQGRDPIKIAKDMEEYLVGGKKVLAKRYGKLEAGTKEFFRRIPQNVDYRALRIVRSELYMSLKEAGVASGKMNPAALDAYDWIMQAGRADWSCACPDYAHGSPYKANDVPTQPHSNCGCYLQARLMDNDTFVDDLKRWQNGENVPYLDDWKENYYD
jgi:hypothetical protein